jgi:Ser/Thr protein kinase RdoA (MazF antagonist)
MTSLGRAALEGYLSRGARLRLLGHRYNLTFRVSAPGGERYLLRLHHPGQTSVAAVRSELLWLAALREEAGLPVPESVPDHEQSLVTVVTEPGKPQPRLCVLFRWMEGRFLFKGLTPSHLFRVGDLMGRLQQHAARWPRPPEFTRHRVDNLDSLCRSRDDRFDEAVAEEVIRTVAAVSAAEDADTVAVVIANVWQTMRALGEGPEVFGLIHADLHHRNYLFHRGAAGAIDFDDSGFGHWLYDLAVPLTELRRHPDYPTLRQALLAGYRRHRPLPPEHEALLPRFHALRGIQNVMGVIQDREHPKFRETWQAVLAREIQALRQHGLGEKDGC